MEEASSGDYMVNIVAHLEDLFGRAIRCAYPSLAEPPILVTPSSQKTGADYQCNSAMSVCKVRLN